MATSKTLQGATSYDSRWHTQRINRRLDDRDNLVAEALQLVEQWDTTSLPTIVGLSGVDPSVGAGGGSTGVTLTVGGAGVGDSTQSSGASTAGVGTLTFTAIAHGESSYTVAITDTGAVAAGGEVVTAVGDAWSIDTDVLSTVAQIKTAWDAHALAPLVMSCTIAAGVSAVEMITVDGGVGEAMTFSIGAANMLDGTAATCVTANDGTTITFDYDQTGGTAGDLLPIYLRLDGVLCPVVSILLTA